MDFREYAVAMAEYNSWMNHRLYDVAEKLTDEERKRDLGAFFKSVHGTLSHLVLGDQAWMQRFRKEPVTMISPDQELFENFGNLKVARKKLDVEISDWARRLDSNSIEQSFNFYSVSYKKERTLPLWAAIVHMFNHQTHHRGQVTTLLKQLGHDPGITDLPWMAHFDTDI